MSICVMPAIKLIHPLDPLQTSVFSDLVEELARNGVEYVVIGALARDIVLWHRHGIKAGLATRDTDAAILVTSWDEYNAIKAALVESGLFREPVSPEHQPQRLIHLGANDDFAMPVDLVPFEGIERESGMIVWPPNDFVMNTTGHREVLTRKLEIEIADDLILNVASIAGIVILKIFAWNDRPTERKKDAHDVNAFIQNYQHADNQDRLFGEEIEILEQFDFEHQRAGAFLLGKDVAELASPETRAALTSIISNPSTVDLLATHMIGGTPFEEKFDHTASLLDIFLTGFRRNAAS
jgi:predicted nucleotidyltransferase